MESVASAAVCPACGYGGSFREFSVREMQFGTRENFTYRECPECGSLHIASVPADLSRHYPKDYYSFDPIPGGPVPWMGIRRTLASWLVSSPDPIARRISGALRYRRYAFFEWGRITKTGLSANILDVGCGSGGLIRRMQRFGFSKLTGVDPYAPKEIREPGFRVLQSESAPPGETYDLIMMHHVLEHVANPEVVLSRTLQSLAPGGRILLRIPLSGSAVHRLYGTDWYHLDAPRHLVIPSVRGLEKLVARAGAQIIHQGFDGGEPSILMSESYQRDIPSRQAPRPNRRTRVRNRRIARRYNRGGEGDLGVFVLTAKRF